MRTTLAIIIVSLWVATAVAGPPRSTKSKWIPTRPHKIDVRPQGTSKILDDQSIQFDGDVGWGDATVYFAFKKPTSVSRIRFELLPAKDSADKRFGSATKRLLLFDIKPIREDRAGKRTFLQFSECRCREFPDDDTLDNCIDYLSDTGWVVPPLPKGASSHALIMQFDQAIKFNSDQFLALEVDLGGGASEFDVLSRIRVSFVAPTVKQPSVKKQ